MCGNLYVVMHVIPSPIGPITLTSDHKALTGLYVEDRGPADATQLPLFTEVERQLEEYFAGSRTSFDIPLAPKGTPFQLDVWSALTRIPYGETWTYAKLAVELGRAGAARAVGSANGRNPISIVIPCHRVIGSAGSLTGYGGGLPAKRFLLDLEGVSGARPGSG
jgi:methylated-DNA-[protein]-cysteine S-methyltransferase